jgi:hypothetical protein
LNENHTTLKIFGFKGPVAELNARLQLKPTKTALKGEERSYGPSHRGEKRVYPWNYWEFRWTRSENRFIGDLVEEFMAQVVEPRKDALKEVIATCSGELSVVQYYYSGCNPGFHLSAKTLSLLSHTGVEVDVDIYCLASEAKISA